MSKIDKKFYHDTDGVEAETVGELIDLLKELPRELKTSGWPEREKMLVCVYNVNMENPHLGVNLD